MKNLKNTAGRLDPQAKSYRRSKGESAVLVHEAEAPKALARFYPASLTGTTGATGRMYSGRL